MAIYDFVTTRKGETALTHHVTNTVSERLLKAYVQSFTSGQVVDIEGSSWQLLANKTGDWGRPLLSERADKLGMPFRVSTYDLEDLSSLTVGEMRDKFAKANFFFASPTRVTVFWFIGWDGWGLKPLGLEVQNSAKLAKRLTEANRLVGFHYYGSSSKKVIPADPEGRETDHDGIIAISESFAAKIGIPEDVYRGTLRTIFEHGLVKGDYVKVPDANLEGYDMAFEEGNLKHELSTDGWELTTVIKNEPYHEMSYDAQTMANFSFFIPHQMVQDDLVRMVKDWLQSLREGGDLYNYLKKAQGVYDDPMAIDLERVQMSDRLEENAELLTQLGIPQATFANIPFMATTKLLGKMEKGRIQHLIQEDNGSFRWEKTNFFKRMFIPASNAFVGGVMTYEFMTEIAGVDFPEQDGTRTFWDKRYGLIIPGQRFADTYNHHGGFDSDDHLSVILVKIWSSDKDVTKMLRKDGALDPAIGRMPGKPEHARYVGLSIRRPNGPGEYSLEAIDMETMPFAHLDLSKVRTYDLADAPLPQGEVFKGTKVAGITSTMNYSVPFSKEVAYEMVMAQLINPGVGRMANVLMTWAATFGVDNVPDKMLALMEDIIDTVQQTADAVAFEQIDAECTRLWMLFAEKVISEGISVDSGFLDGERVPTTVYFDGEPTPVGKAIREAGLVHKGTMGSLFSVYNKGMERMRKEAMTATRKARYDTPLYQKIQGGNFGATDMKWASSFAWPMSKRLREMGQQARNTPPTQNAILKKQEETLKRLAVEEFMDQVVDSLMEIKELATHRQILALYKVLTMPTDAEPYGGVDRLMVQPTSPGHISMLELFISACAQYGLLQPNAYVKWDDSRRGFNG